MALTRATDKIIANADGNLNLSGIVTAANFVGGGAGLTGLNVDASALKSGSDIKAQANPHGVVVTGVLTATSFSGDGANLTGVSGFSTALSNTEGTLENLIFKTTETFTIGAGQSIRLESDNISGNTLFTRLGRINVSTGATFHVSAGTTFVMNVLSVF